MGVSFKVSKTGTRFRPKPVQPDSAVEEDGAGVNPKEIGRNESTSTSTKKLEVFFFSLFQTISCLDDEKILESVGTLCPVCRKDCRFSLFTSLMKSSIVSAVLILFDAYR